MIPYLLFPSPVQPVFLFPFSLFPFFAFFFPFFLRPDQNQGAKKKGSPKQPGKTSERNYLPGLLHLNLSNRPIIENSQSTLHAYLHVALLFRPLFIYYLLYHRTNERTNERALRLIFFFFFFFIFFFFLFFFFWYFFFGSHPRFILRRVYLFLPALWGGHATQLVLPQRHFPQERPQRRNLLGGLGPSLGSLRRMTNTRLSRGKFGRGILCI